MGAITTRVFMNGHSQAVRIPAEFRLDADQVTISRNGRGELVIRPLKRRPDRGTALLEALEALHDDEFVAALASDREQALPMQERDPL